jgi:hypothetical protein
VAYDFVFSDPNLPKVAMSIRPFLAMNQALFDLYHDLTGMHEFILVVNVVLLLLAVLAAFGYGLRRGGIMAGILAGGLLAASPIVVEYSLLSRPYSMAWSFGAMAMYAAATRRPAWAGVLLGLSIGSRVEMILLLPLVICEVWERKAWIKATFLALVTAYAVAPWLLTGLAGNLRAIATIQIANPGSARETLGSVLRDFGWDNALGPAAILFLLGIPVLFAIRQRTRAILVLLISATVFKATGFGLHHHGAAIVAIIFGAVAVTGAIHQRWPRLAAVAVCLTLIFPLAQSLRIVRHPPAVSEADWIESNVRPGTVVYLESGLLKVPLPTTHAADLIWGEVTAPNAWRRKFASGLQRYGLTGREILRAMSEENLVQDHGALRRWFILGSEMGGGLGRYELRLIQPSPLFGVQTSDIAADFSRTGGVVLWQPDRYGPPPPELGKPVDVFPDADGARVLVFRSSP